MVSLVQIVVAALLVGVLMGCGAQAPRGSGRDADIAAIKAVSDARAEAFRRGDAAGIAIHFTEGGVLMAPGAPFVTGRAAVQAYYQKLFDAMEADLESGYVAVEVDGDLAYGQGFAKVTARPHEGGEVSVSTAKYINILKRQADGTWKTTHDIWNANE
jgi:uncharacterized protein (TIGR02246 family)